MSEITIQFSFLWMRHFFPFILCILYAKNFVADIKNEVAKILIHPSIGSMITLIKLSRIATIARLTQHVSYLLMVTTGTGIYQTYS